jgi:predicted DNA-binding mobile mystery protein A
MKRNSQRLQGDQLWRRLSRLSARELREAPGKGWVRSIREALGMSSAQLARRIGVKQQTVADWEDRERKQTISLASIRKIAAGLECDLVYALVPRTSFKKILEGRALEVAAASVEQVSHSMALEDQQTGERRRTQLIRETAKRLLDEQSHRLWDV